MSEAPGPGPVPRVPTGIRGFDDVVGGGLFAGGVYIVMGMPGAGKTIMGNQIAFSHARGGGRAVYVTLLSESHGRLLAFLKDMAFFEQAAVGDALRYLNGYGAIEAEGLAGLLKLVRQVVRESRASLIVIDGMITAAAIASSDTEYKKFVEELQSWIEVVGCTVVLLTSARADELRPEYTMVDGIVELDYARVGSRRVRELTVLKFRGSAYAEGKHTYDITAAGITLYPRAEGVFGRRPRAALPDGVAGLGDRALDRAVGGGLPRGSTALVVGPAGAGKTSLGLQFLSAGLDGGEGAVHLGFAEDPAASMAVGDALGLRLGERARSGALAALWFPAAEPPLDRIAHDLVAALERTGAQRVFVDGVEAVQGPGVNARAPAFWAAMSQELRARGVTAMFALETRQPAVCDGDAPTAAIWGIGDTVISLRQVERAGSLLRVMTVPKMRGTDHEREVVRYDVTHRGARIGERFVDDGARGARETGARERRRSTGGRRRKR